MPLFCKFSLQFLAKIIRKRRWYCVKVSFSKCQKLKNHCASPVVQKPISFCRQNFCFAFSRQPAFFFFSYLQKRFCYVTIYRNQKASSVLFHWLIIHFRFTGSAFSQVAKTFTVPIPENTGNCFSVHQVGISFPQPQNQQSQSTPATYFKEEL